MMYFFQGFICPQCMKTFNSAEILQNHFQEHNVIKKDYADGGVSILGSSLPSLTVITFIIAFFV